MHSNDPERIYREVRTVRTVFKTREDGGERHLAGYFAVFDSDYEIAPGERVAQLMFMPVYTANLILCDELDETERGAGGFGSTGTK